MNKQLKKHNSTGYNRELKTLNELRVLLIEQSDLLNQLDAKDISELENEILNKTGFKNIQASATLLGIENEYSRITEIEKIINSRIKPTDLTADKEFKKSFLNKLKDSYNTYYTDIELRTLKRLNEVINIYNKLDLEEKKQLAFNYDNLQISPFSYLKR